jgi:hypothetical protein
MTGMGIDIFRLHSYKEFQFWMAHNEDMREELEELIGVQLNVDEDSLDQLEYFLLKRYRAPEEALEPGERRIFDAASRYIGLVFILNVDGAKWAINLKDEDQAYFRLPVIKFGDSDEECPLSTVFAALDRREGDYMRSVLKYYEEKYNTTTDGR